MLRLPPLYDKAIGEDRYCSIGGNPLFKWLYPYKDNLIPQTANREAESTGDDVVVTVDEAAIVAQGADTGIGHGQEGGGPPPSVSGQVEKISDVVAKAARQGREARRIGGP